MFAALAFPLEAKKEPAPLGDYLFIVELSLPLCEFIPSIITERVKMVVEKLTVGSCLQGNVPFDLRSKTHLCLRFAC